MNAGLTPVELSWSGAYQGTDFPLDNRVVRRITSCINGRAVARSEPALYAGDFDAIVR